MRMLSIAVFPLAAWFCVPAWAGTVIIPPGNATVAGGGFAPNILGPNAYTFQTVIGTPLLTGLTAGDIIDGIQFRLQGGLPTGPAVTTIWSDWSLTLSPSNNAPGSLSPTFAANIAAGAVTVRSGPLTLPADSMPGGASPNPFGPLIAFTTPYTYTGGNLLLTLTHTNASSGSGVTLDYQGMLANLAEHQNTPGYQATTATVQQMAMPVIQLTIHVPEPPAIVMAGTALGLVLGAGWWRRRRC